VQVSTDAVWSKLSDDLRSFIRRRMPDEHVAEDVLQETFVRIHRGIVSISESDRLEAWVYQITRNVIADHYRKQVANPVEHDIDVAEETNDSLPTLPSRAAEWLQELIRQLPDTYREAVQLSEIEGLPLRVVAERLGLSLSGVKSRVQRGRASLRESLNQCCRFEFDRRGNLLDCEPKPHRTVCLDCDDAF